MTVWKANLNKEWRRHRSLLIDYLFLAAGLAALFPLDNFRGFGLVGCLLAASLGARIGGDEAIHGTWEFVLTRPVTREGWLRLRFLLGLIPLGLLALLFLIFDAIELNALIGRIVADPLGPAGARGVTLLGYLAPAAGVLLVYTFSFSFALRERRPENVLHQRAAGLISGLLVMGVLLAASQFGFRSLSGDWTARPGPEQAVLSVVVLIVVGLVYLGTRRSFTRREFAGAGGETVAARSGAGLAVVLMLLLGLILVGALFLTAAYRSEREPPATAPSVFTEGK